MDIREQLRKCYLCAELNENELSALERIAVFRDLAKDEILFLQGDIATGFYILLSGRVRVYKASPEGKEFTLHLIAPGQMFAEAAIFRGQEFPANASALQDSTVAFFPKEQFVRLIADSPQMSLKMIGGLSAFVREFNQMVEDLSLREVPARLAAFLLIEYEKTPGKTLRLEISKAELARKLGTISETLSRNLKKFRELQVVDVDGRSITILDAARLQAIASGEKV